MSLTLSKSERIEIIDVLRGFALLGIILVHMVEQYYAGRMPESIINQNPGSLADNIFQGFVSIFVMGKFYMIFSFLFGLSFSMQSDKGKNDGRFLLRFTWRLILLFVIGMLHHIHYRGDILGIYAILGLGLLLFFRASDKTVLVAALILVFNIPSVLLRIGEGVYTGDATMFPAQNETELINYYETVKSGTYRSILMLNLFDFSVKMSFQLLSGRVFVTFGLFLLGLYAGRKKVFSDLPANIGWLKKLIGYSWKTLLAVVLFAAAFFGGAFLLELQLPQFVQFAVGGFVYDVFNLCMASLYLSGIILLFQKESWRKSLMNFYHVGRMGLTTYLIQSVFGFLIFFSPGLGLLGELGGAVCFGLALLLYLAQIAFSKLWFRFFYYGFFEWAWRSLTYFKWQPLFRTKTDLVPAN